MILLDTDTLSFWFAGHARLGERIRQSSESVVTSAISRIETLEGRFAFVKKAADAEQLVRAFRLLELSERSLSRVNILPIDDKVGTEFDKLLRNKKLRKVGRADLLIASVALAHKVKLVTRNLRDYRLIPGLIVENWVD